MLQDAVSENAGHWKSPAKRTPIAGKHESCVTQTSTDVQRFIAGGLASLWDSSLKVAFAACSSWTQIWWFVPWISWCGIEALLCFWTAVHRSEGTEGTFRALASLSSVQSCTWCGHVPAIVSKFKQLLKCFLAIEEVGVVHFTRWSESIP